MPEEGNTWYRFFFCVFDRDLMLISLVCLLQNLEQDKNSSTGVYKVGKIIEGDTFIDTTCASVGCEKEFEM